jgi:uncharacterized protein YlxW (UPF0749 family)
MNIKTQADAVEDSAQLLEQQSRNMSWYPIARHTARNAETTAKLAAQVPLLQQQINDLQTQIQDLQAQVKALQASQPQ